MKTKFFLAAFLATTIIGTSAGYTQVLAGNPGASSSSSSADDARNNRPVNHKKKIAGLLALSKQHIADKNYGSARETLAKLHKDHGYTQEFKNEKHHYDEQLAAVNSKE